MNLGVPLGVAKSVREIPGDEEGSLIDLSNALYLSRSFVLFKDIDDNIVNEVASMILYLNQDNPLKELFLFINFRGGSIRAAMGMYNLITELSADVNTVALGKCGSSASLILVGRTLNKCSAFPHARILLHEPEIEKEDSSQNEELIRDAGEREDRHKIK